MKKLLFRLAAAPLLLLAWILVMPVVFLIFSIRRGLVLRWCSRRRGEAARMKVQERPSFTAEGVAIMRAVLTVGYGLLDDWVTVEMLDWDTWCIVQASAWTTFVLGPSFRKMGPLVLHVLSRTLELDAFIIENQPQQVVILGAGLDARAYRLGSVPESTRFFEVDAPASQRMKRRLVEGAHRRRNDGFIRDPKQVVMVPCDFSTESFMDKLVENGFDTKNRQTVFICEGVSMYLEPSEVEAMMKQVSTRCALGTRFAMQVSRTDGTTPSKESQRLSKIVASVGERFKWRMHVEQTPDSFFGPMGFKTLGTVTFHESLVRRHLDHLPGADSKRANQLQLGQIIFMEVVGKN